MGGWYSDKEREDARPEEALVGIGTRETSVIIFKQLRFNVYIIKKRVAVEVFLRAVVREI